MKALGRRGALVWGFGASVGLAARGNTLPAVSTARPGALQIDVGPDRPVRSLAEAARLAGRAAADIRIDAATYEADAAVAVWDGADAVITAVGGRVRLRAAGAAAEGKAIWVVRGSRLRVSGIDFLDARVQDQNGAGIRLESGALVVHDCAFGANENGILTGNDGTTTLDVEHCEFGHNGHGDGQSHNLYVGAIARLRVAGCWMHHARHGHLLKSRAAHNLVVYNRLLDGDGGVASYELEFPSGGIAIVLGNVLQQAASTDNPHIVSYGAEGYRWPRNELLLVNNTLIDDRRQGGVPLRVRPGAGPVRVLNNLLLGGNLDLTPAIAPGDYRQNHRAGAADFEAGAERVRLRAASPLAGRAADPGMHDGLQLRPAFEPLAPRGMQAREEVALHPGALAPRPAGGPRTTPQRRGAAGQ